MKGKRVKVAGEHFQVLDVPLPVWAHVSEKRKAHILRVTQLLVDWAHAMEIGAEEFGYWLLAGGLHDALRDAPEKELRKLAKDKTRDAELLHGPAVANLLEKEGQVAKPVIDAIRYHTVGSADWGRTGRALYMADFLEPGRKFAQADRAFLASKVPHDFDGVFRQVLRMRLEYALREGFTLFPETVELWNAVR